MFQTSIHPPPIALWIFH